MACGCKGRVGIKYEVKFADNSTQTYDTLGEAQQAGNASGGSYTFKAVPA